MLITKNSPAHINMLFDKKARASPSKTVNTPMIMGFLTWRYGPFITNFFGGDQGANVPLPILMNEEIVMNIRVSPDNMSRNPANK